MCDLTISGEKNGVARWLSAGRGYLRMHELVKGLFAGGITAHHSLEHPQMTAWTGLSE